MFNVSVNDKKNIYRSKPVMNVDTVGSSGGGVQSDWNQNDSTAADYVKNRPFYTAWPVPTVLIEETTAPFEDTGEGHYFTLLQLTNILSAGETYIVSWDGTLYESVCADVDGLPVIGNLSIMAGDSDTGEPFMICENNSIQIATLNTSASHTISISRLGVPEVVKIDEKYLPTILAPIYIIKNDSTNQRSASGIPTFSSSITFEEAWKLPPNILMSRLNLAFDASSVEGGRGSSCREVSKSNTRNLGENIVATFSVLSANSDNTYDTTNCAIVWTKNGIAELTLKDGV